MFWKQVRGTHIQAGAMNYGRCTANFAIGILLTGSVDICASEGAFGKTSCDVHQFTAIVEATGLA